MPKQPPKPKKYEPGENPASRRNLHPRKPSYTEEKSDRRLTVTSTGWDGCKALASELGLSGVSELLECLGRAELIVSRP
jgi:hypothetical protein